MWLSLYSIFYQSWLLSPNHTLTARASAFSCLTFAFVNILKWNSFLHMTQRVLWLHLSMCKTCGVEREDALNICNICFHCINHAAWCCAAWCCAGCRAPPLNNSSSWWLGGSWPRLPTGTRHGLGGGSSPGKLATFWQLISWIAIARCSPRLTFAPRLPRRVYKHSAQWVGGKFCECILESLS